MKKGKEYIVSKYDNCQVVWYNYYFENREECENYKLKDSEQVIEVKLTTEDYPNFKWVMCVQEVRTVQNNRRFNMNNGGELNNFFDEKSGKFNADYCNEKTHKTIAAHERDTIRELILTAAKSGCFSTIIPDCHIDTRNWLKDLGFNVYYSGSYHVEWKDITNQNFIFISF